MATEADFTPKRRLLQSVTQAEQALCMTTEDHKYNVDDTVRVIVPLLYGMHVNSSGTILTVPTDDTFTIDIDTSASKTFVVPASPYTQAHVIPMAGQSTDNIARQ